MTLTKTERQRILSHVPWITKRKTPIQCEAYKWSSMPLKAVHSMHGKEPTGIEKYRCSKPGYWKFRALKRAYFPAKDGTYCWMHLVFSGIHHNPEEDRRFEKWYEKWKVQDASNS